MLGFAVSEITGFTVGISVVSWSVRGSGVKYFTGWSLASYMPWYERLLTMS